MNFIKYISGFFREDRPQSSKRLMGIASGGAFLIASLCAGLHWYDIPEYVIYSLAGYSAACLGISSIGFFNKKSDAGK